MSAILVTSVAAGLGWWLPAAFLWGAYALFAVLNTVLSVRREKNFSAWYLLLPFLFFLLHLFYGLGSIGGFLCAPRLLWKGRWRQ